MAKYKKTGRTWEQILEMQEEYDGNKPFDQQYCLSKIPHQPEEYDGPPRFCIRQGGLRQRGSNMLCKFHGGHGSHDPERLDKLGAMKHGMKATREHLIEDFDEKDQALYDWVVEHFPDAYDIDVENDPTAAYDLHRLAAEIVRAERGRGFLLDEGEVNETPVRNDEGRVVTDDNGDIVTEKSEHYLAKMMDRQDRKITKLEKELMISRKERAKQENTDSAVEAIKSFSELGQKFLNRDSKDFDPDDAPWEEDDDG